MTAPTLDWQATIRGLFTIGRDTNYPGLGSTDGAGLDPFIGTATAATAGNRVTFGEDRLGVRRLRIRVRVLGDTEAEAWQRYRALASAWRPEASGDEVTLDVRWPGMTETVMRAYGHPAGARPILAGIIGGVIDTEVAFDADPFWYGSAVAQASAASPVTITAAGETGADSTRATLTIHGNGGTPSVTLDDGTDITFTQTLGVGETYVIDLHARTVTKGGVNADAHVSPASTWFAIPGGRSSVLTLTGAAALTVSYRPAHWSP